MKKKLTIIIPVLALTLLVSACAKKPVVNQNLNANTNQPINQNQNVNIGINSNINQATKKSNFTLTKDPDGWKTYTNYDLGIRFRFEDKEDRIYLRYAEKYFIEFFERGTEISKMYITKIDSFNDHCCSNDDSLRSSTKYGLCNSFIEFINKCGWEVLQTDSKLLSLEKFNNTNIPEALIATIRAGTYAMPDKDGKNPAYIYKRIYITYPDSKTGEYLHIFDNEKMMGELLETFEYINY